MEHETVCTIEAPAVRHWTPSAPALLAATLIGATAGAVIAFFLELIAGAGLVTPLAF